VLDIVVYTGSIGCFVLGLFLQAIPRVQWSLGIFFDGSYFKHGECSQSLATADEQRRTSQQYIADVVSQKKQI